MRGQGKRDGMDTPHVRTQPTLRALLTRAALASLAVASAALERAANRQTKGGITIPPS